MAVVFLVLRPVLKARARPALDDSRPPAETPALTGTVLPAAEVIAEPVAPIVPPRASEQLALPPGDPVARLRNMMKERHDESVKILTGWIDNKENAL